MAELATVNSILSLMGKTPISSIESSEFGPPIAKRIDDIHREEMSDFPWSAVFSLFEMAPLTETVPNLINARSSYALPSSLLRIESVHTYINNVVGSALGPDDYAVYGNTLFVRSDQIVRVLGNDARFTEQQVGALYADALAYRVAAEISPLLLQTTNFVQLWESKYAMAMKDAREQSQSQSNYYQEAGNLLNGGRVNNSYY